MPNHHRPCVPSSSCDSLHIEVQADMRIFLLNTNISLRYYPILLKSLPPAGNCCILEFSFSFFSCSLEKKEENAILFNAILFAKLINKPAAQAAGADPSQ